MKLFDAIWYNGGKGPSDGNNYWRRYTGAHYTYVAVLLVIFSVWLGLFTTALLNGSGVEEAACLPLVETQWFLLHGFVLALVFCLYFATGRAWITSLAVSAPVIVCALVLRSEIGAHTGQLPRFMPPSVEETILIVVTVVLCPAILALSARGHIRNGKARLAGALVSAVIAAGAAAMAVELRV